MSIELKEAAQQPVTPSLQAVCRYISDVLAGDASSSEKHIARTIMHLLPLEQALSGQQPVTGEPVGYMNEGHIHEFAMRRIPYGYVYPEAGAGAATAVYTHPAPSDDVVLDAARYRYLRNRTPGDVLGTFGTSAGCWIDCEDDHGALILLTGSDSDAAIDAAMLAAK